MKIACTKSTALRWIGLVLFLASFPLPDADFGENGVTWSSKDNGFGIFCMTPIMLTVLIADGAGWRVFAAGAALALAWITNFSIFFRIPREFAWALMLPPWLLFATFMLDWYPNGRSIAGYLPFYPWAIGIGFVHFSSYFVKTFSPTQLDGRANAFGASSSI